MRISLSLLAVLSMLSATSAVSQTLTPQPEQKLDYVLILSRHGVRSPTGKAAQYDRFSKADWPKWTTAPGELTPHGYALMKIFGAYDRALFAQQGLLTGQGCDDAVRIAIHADSDQRTRETGHAMAEGFLPGCNVSVEAKPEGTNDPLFHVAATTPSQAQLAAAGVLGRIGNDPSAVAAAYHAPLAEFDDLLAGCGEAESGHARSSLFDIPASVSASSGDHLADVKGPLNTAGTLAENLLLEYTEGFDAKQVGWGCVDGARLRTLIDLHTASSDIALRTPAVAEPLSAALMQVIGASLEQASERRAVAGAEGKPGDKVLLLVGHDTNLSTIAGALRLSWILDGRRDDTPPGAALVFELREDAAGHRTVHLFFTAQTLEQMRNTTPLTLAAPPPRVPVFVPGCSGPDGGCDLNSFTALLRTAAR
ncbi:histidine-type phosphatase [Silvibacterium acidisoli]|uniref:histidine-type phosphatase n=1 Tax=Acidobacteriaceae bacterium ZG23-2 TaxID=2883246 RepID=UPI00406BF5F5